MGLLTWQPPTPDWPIPTWYPVNDQQYTAIKSLAELLLYGGGSGGGKRLDIDTLLPTPDGWVRMGDTQVGDTIFDDTGTPTRITYCSPIALAPQSYRVIFDDGSELIADADHNWHTFTHADRKSLARRTDQFREARRANRASRSTGKRPDLALRNSLRSQVSQPLPTGSVRTTEQIMRSLRDGEHTNHAIPIAQPLCLEDAPLPIHPYVLGAWLGDGSHDSGRFTSADRDVLTEIERCGFSVGNHRCAVNGQRTSWTIYRLKPLLRHAGLLKNKHVPERYLRASYEQRLALLSGFMDTDGDCGSDGKAEFINTRNCLSEAVFELAASLGLKPTIREGRSTLKGIDCGPKWRVGWTSSLQVFRLPRKQRRIKTRLRGVQRWRYIVDVQPVEPRLMRCISVDSPSHLYLAGKSMIPTHNTDLLVGDAIMEWQIPTMRSLFIRRSFTEMQNIMDRCDATYKPLGARWRGHPEHAWAFPSGAKVRMGYMKEDGNVTHYQGIPFSKLLVDESTFLIEKSVRDLLPWLAVPDPRLFKCIRLGTNPGEIGADWHIRTLLKGHCPIHHPEKSVEPYAIYRRGVAKWSDDVRVPLTTQFIPSLAKHNPFYGEQKLALLETQTADRRERLLTGCWCSLAGRYFDFLSPAYKRPYAESGEQWWHTHTICIDYGFGGSWAAAGLYFITEPSPEYPEGQMFKVAEMAEKQMGSKDFARKVCQEWVEPTIGTLNGEKQRRRFVCWYHDPAMDSHTGTGKSNCELMDEVFQQYDIPRIAAAKDRIGNAQNLYNMLKYQQVVICDTAPATFNSLATRMHDPKKPGDIKKMVADVMDDYFDETSYNTNTFFESAVKPKDVAFLEKIQKMKEAGSNDHTLWIEQQRRLLEKDGDDNEPIYLGRSHGRTPIIRR